MKVVLKKVGVLSVAKIYAIITAVTGLLVGIIFSVIGFVVQTLTPVAEVTTGFLALGAFNIIAMPILYGLMGFVFGALGAWLYNVLAKGIGGVELEFDK